MTTLSPETNWSFPSDQPRYIWVGCTHKHARQVYPEHAATRPPCDVCRLPMVPLSERAIAAYKRHNRLCEHCKLGRHILCTGVNCFGCDRSNHTHAKTEIHAASS